MLNGAIDIATGYETYVPVTRTLYKKLKKPYSNCVDSLKSFESVSSYSKTLSSYMKQLNATEYNQEFCYDLCFQGKQSFLCHYISILLTIFSVLFHR